MKDVLPDFKLHQEAGIAEMDLKVRDLLCHRSGESLFGSVVRG